MFTETSSKRSLLSDTTKAELRAAFPERVRFDEPLAPYLWFRVGGPADAVVFPRDEEDLEKLRHIAAAARLPITVLGTGTNLLVKDGGIRGLVVFLLAAGFSRIDELPAKDGHPGVCAGGGVTKPQLLEWALQRGYAGLEFSAGVPGTIGGGIFMNAGTKYGCYGDILEELRLYDFAKGPRTLQRRDAHFGYREQSAVGDALVLWSTFRLRRGDATALRAEVDRIIAERAEKQPLDFPSCGSTFKNPEGHSAGRLIERAGLKGLRVGGAEISLKHANFILNKGNATASDILALIGMMKERVYGTSGIELECEVIVLGEDPSAGSLSGAHRILAPGARL